MSLTRKQIEIIIENTPKELKGKQMSLNAILGYYQKSNANWSYRVGYVQHKKQNILVVTMFGEIL